MDKIKTIAHLADIHIRKLHRFVEYRDVFNRLYKKLKEAKPDLIYIGGDIVHGKLDTSPEEIRLLADFFLALADISPTLIIPGNHDCNLNNKSREDVLSPVVDLVQQINPNLLYWKKSGVYELGDCQFGFLSVFDITKEGKPNVANLPKAKDIKGDNKIAVFHGGVGRFEVDTGLWMSDDNVNANNFAGYDMVLLGDIHKRQHLNKEETISYCGSLVQQNHGEGLSHGYLLWDVPNRKSEYIEIQNDYGYYTLDIDNGVVPDADDMPSKARLRVRVANTSATELKKALAVIHDKHGVVEMSVTRTDTIHSNDRVRNDKITVGDINSTDVQFNLIREYLDNNHIVNDEILLKIKNINESLNQVIPEEEVYRNVNWKLKHFEFSNMFSYGENNKVDFTKLNGIVGMFAPNAAGKSSLLDALSFCLFDTCTRAFKAENVLNNKKGDFFCKVNFEIDGQDYHIERVAKKQRKGNVKVDVDFYTFGDDGEKVSMNGDQRRTTQNNIKKVIGSYDDFILTSLSSQIKNSVFIEKTQKEKKTLLAQFMGLEIFDKLWVAATDEIRDVSAVLKNFKKNDWERDLADIKEQKEDLKKIHKKRLNKKDEIQSKKK